MVEQYSHNFLQNNGFVFSLARIPQTTFRVTSCEVPSISVPPPQAGYPGADQYFPGTNSVFDSLSIKFLVDEDLKNYEEIYRWLTQQRFAIGKGFVEKNDKEEFLVSDATLVTMTNASNTNRIFYFKDVFPIDLGSLRFDTSVTQSEPISCTATFRFSYFELR